MSKEVLKGICSACDSSFKVVYDPGMASGYPKFCPFCGSACFDDDLEDKKYEDEDG